MRPPEIRIKNISIDNVVEIEFTNEMNFPQIKEFNDFIQRKLEQKALNKRQQNESDKNFLLDVKVFSVDKEEFDENLATWTLISISSKSMSI